MTISSQITAGFALILSLAGTMACASSPAPAQKGSPAWFVAQAAKPWLPRYDPKTDWNFTHAGKGAQQACLRSEALPIPQADLPTAAEAPRLMSCNSEALYYGFAGKPDYARARTCAYLERAAGNRFPVASSAILSMIYANGLGAKRNLPLATKFACEAGGAPAEIDARVGHLEDLATMTAQPGQRFGFCDDITSGYMDGICAGVAATYRDARREKSIARVASSYTPTQRAAFSALRDAAADYFNAHARNEVDLSGTARGAFWIEDIQHSWNVFLRDLLVLEADKLPAADAEANQQADTRLNALFHRVLAEPSLRQRAPPGFPPPGIPVAGGTISRQGIRADQYLWLSYRDAWLHFAAARRPALPRSTVQAWITNQRIHNLSCLLPFPTSGARDCTRPTLLPSNMRQ
jgi:hypothetical protein